MSELVGNPEDTFSHNEAHFILHSNQNVKNEFLEEQQSKKTLKRKRVGQTALFRITNEPRREKTGLRGVRPGPTQINLYGHRRWIET